MPIGDPVCAKHRTLLPCGECYAELGRGNDRGWWNVFPTDDDIDALLTALFGKNKLMPWSPSRPEKRVIVRKWLSKSPDLALRGGDVSMSNGHDAVLRAALEGLTKAQWRHVAETVGVDVSDGELLIMRDALYEELSGGPVSQGEP